jgi:hypothetical protein
LHKAAQFNVTVISRVSSKATEYPPSINVVQVPDGYPYPDMVQAFRGSDAVVLALGFAGEQYLPSLGRASVEAGVKRVIASGYGADTNVQATVDVFPVAGKKAAMIKDLVSLERPGWSWSDVACGVFLDL